MSEKIAVFPGSFDPFTNGHLEIVNSGLKFFDRLIIGFGINTTKKRYFPLDDIKQKLIDLFHNRPEVDIKEYSGLTVDFATKHDARFILRGIRNSLDFEYEKTIAANNLIMQPDIQTVFLVTPPHTAHISSTIIREIHKNNGSLEGFIPFPV